ncbi:MAG: CpsD/CapB family tyrosine-protein kinase [Clostridia bacterium]|nr:CpsD/CapB family tyrosine-protein kinase [Clostridia bacterium]
MSKKENPARNPAPIASTFQIVEAYKAIRTNLLFALSTSENKIVAISSAEPNAGKSTSAANLAITMAQTGAKVLLIDGDMRKPSLHKTFRVKRTNGLSMILSGLAPLEDCIFREVAKGLDLIPSGTIPPNPSELLGSAAMDNLLTEISKQYDYVFIDMPPLGVVTDALILSSKVAGISLVCRQKQTTYEELKAAIDNIHNVGGRFLGVIITGVRRDLNSYGHYSKYRYYKYYNYSYSSTPSDHH